MNVFNTFDTVQVIQVLGFVLSLLASIMLFGHRLGAWVKTSFDFTPIHFLIGMLLSLGVTVVLINWQIEAQPSYVVSSEIFIDETIQIPATVQLPKKKVPPPPPPASKTALPKLKKPIEYRPVDQVVTSAPTVTDQEDVATPAIDTVMYSEPAPRVSPPVVENDPNEIIKVPDQMPRFPGCELLDVDLKEKSVCATQHLLDYLYREIDYPALARANGIEGMAVVQFVVEPDGSISEIKLLRDPGAGCGKAAVRVVKQMNKMGEKWTPGRQRGRPVRVLYTLPVKFKLK